VTRVRAWFGRILGAVRKASAVVRRAVTVALLAVAYVAVLPWLSLYLRMRAPRPGGLRDRSDPRVGSLDRLRQRQ
jgi:hypothetical protein